MVRGRTGRLRGVSERVAGGGGGVVVPVPSKAEYQAATQLWHARAHTYRNSDTVGWIANSTAIQYDAQLGCYYCKDVTGDAATWDTRITRAWQEYNYYVNTVASPAGQIATYLMHIDGFYQDYNRSVVRSPTSLANVTAILTEAPYMVSDVEDLTLQEYSREVAHVGYCHIIAALMGYSLSGAQISRRDEMKSNSMAHLDHWINDTGTYCRPFMVAITAKFLIKYYEEVSQDATIITKLGDVADYIWDNCWKESSGAWGPGQAFLYTDRTGFDAEDGNTQPDLNAVISPLYAWLWYQTGVRKWRERHDDIFVGGIPVYSGDTHISGAYQGTSASPALKQINQQTYWAPQGLIWAEARAFVSQPAPPEPPPAEYDPTTFFTGGTVGPWFDFGNSANVLNGSSTSATDGQTVGTVNDSGTAAINASQSTDGSRPILRASHVNSRNAVECDSADFMDVSGLNAFTNGATSLTICAVFRPTDGTTNHCAWRSFDNSYSYDRVNAIFVGLKPSVKYSRDGGDFNNLRSGAADATAATYHAIIWVIDCTNGQTAIYMDNATYLSLAAAGGSTSAGAMNSTNGNESRILRTSKGYWADLYIHKNAMMDATQRSNWFAAVKTRFGLTTY